MEYKEQISYLRYLAQQSQHIEASAFIRAAESITDLLDSVEAAKVRCETLEKMVKQYQEELIPGYRERTDKAEHERDAAVADLIRAEQAADETCDILDNEIYPVCDYALYLALHNSVSDIVRWGHDDVWRKQEK